ncbi:MAG: hypothetical protein GY756_05240 [bacterium]|nr:hypothetical protein [bacterium]
MCAKSNSHEALFGRNGTEGMLDVILACTLIFLLISCLITVGKNNVQEKVLPAVKLSQSSKQISGTAKVKKNIITLKSIQGKTPEIFLDNKQITIKGLKDFLNTNEGITHIALRRDNNLQCKWEDKIIMLCREAGIKRVGIVIKENTGVGD